MTWLKRFRRKPRDADRDVPHRDERSSQHPETSRSASGPSEPAPSPGQRVPQINIRGEAELIGRFRAHCRDERRTYADMLRVLLDAYEAQERRD